MLISSFMVYKQTFFCYFEFGFEKFATILTENFMMSEKDYYMNITES